MKTNMKTISMVAFTTAAVLLTATATGCKGKTVVRKKIGIVQLVEHPALDKNREGFLAGLAEMGIVAGEKYDIDFQNAQGEQANCVTIAQKFVNDNCDLIFAIATPAAQAAANLTKTIPIVASSVTDPESAKLVKSNGMPGTNVTAASDLTPCAAQIGLIRELLPTAERVGIMYCSSEQNSMFQAELAKAKCRDIGLEIVEATVSNSNEIQQVTQSLVGKVDAIYIPTDNMLASGMATVAQVANDNGILTVVGEEGMLKSGGGATYGIDYYELGKQAAAMAAEILLNGKNPANMPVQYLEKCTFSYNENTFKALGMDLPTGLD